MPVEVVSGCLDVTTFDDLQSRQGLLTAESSLVLLGDIRAYLGFWNHHASNSGNRSLLSVGMKQSQDAWPARSSRLGRSASSVVCSLLYHTTTPPRSC